MKRIRVGFIGAGAIARRAQIPAFRVISGVEIAALCDINAGKLEEVGREFGVTALFTDWRKLLESELDAVVICSPNVFHAPQAIAAMRAGKHVLCEKPVCLSGEEAKEIFRVARESKKVFMGGFKRRFAEETRFLKTMIEDGEFGEIYYLNASWLCRRGIPGTGTWFTSRELAGGGPMADTGVHALDLLVYLAGAPMPVMVAGSTYDHFLRREKQVFEPRPGGNPGDRVGGGMDVEDLATGYVRFDTGATLFIAAGWAGNIEFALDTVIMGSKGGARLLESLDPAARPLVIYGEKNGVLTDIAPKTRPRNLFEAQAAEFVSCVREGRESPLREEEVVSVARIIEGVYRSAGSGEPVFYR